MADETAEQDQAEDTSDEQDQQTIDTEQNTDTDTEQETVQMSKAEADALRRQAAEARKVTKKAEQKAKADSEREAKEQGRWQELVDEAKAEAEEAKLQYDGLQRKLRIQAAASRLNFRDADVAAALLSEDDTEDDQTTERSLKRLAKEKPYLVDEHRRSGGPVVNGQQAGTTPEQEHQETLKQVLGG